AGGLGEQDLLGLTRHAHEAVRAWAVHLVLDSREASTAVRQRLAEMAAAEKAPFVRLYLASGLQRLPDGARWRIARGLVQHGDDAQDTNLSLMIWYGIEPAVPQDPKRTLALLAKSRIPLVREYVVRRLGDPAHLVPVLAQETDAAVQRDLLRGLLAAFEGWG